MLTQHNRKTCRLSPDYTFAIRELGVWSGDETTQTPGIGTCNRCNRCICLYSGPLYLSIQWTLHYPDPFGNDNSDKSIDRISEIVVCEWRLIDKAGSSI